MTNQIVTDEELGHLARRQNDLFARVARGAPNYYEKVMKGLQLLAEPSEGETPLWIQRILEKECKYHRNFFGRIFDLSEFEGRLKLYGQRKIKKWAELGFEPHFLPLVVMTLMHDYPGWGVKLQHWFYMNAAGGKILRAINGNLSVVREVGLDGISVLIDTRLKPSYENGRQMWQNDYLQGSIISQLRVDTKIQDYFLRNSSFGVSPEAWENFIKSVLAQELGFNSKQIRLETITELNAIPQIYTDMPRKNDGMTNTSVWAEEYFEDVGHRLFGGNENRGGLAHVYYEASRDRWNDRSIRFLVEL